MYEFFNHGYTHSFAGANYEFFEKSTEEQLQSIKKTQCIVKEKTGITLIAFGAPCNHIDQNTKNAIEKVNEIKIWFYGLDDAVDKISLKRTVNLEYSCGKISYEFFVNELRYTQKLPKILILQAHPNAWDKKSFKEFEHIVDFLEKSHCEFVLPKEL